MDYFAGLDISMDETHVCALDCEGVIVHESKTASTAEAIAAGQRIRVNEARLPSTWPSSWVPSGDLSAQLDAFLCRTRPSASSVQ